MTPQELVSAITAAQLSGLDKLDKTLQTFLAALELERRAKLWTPVNSGGLVSQLQIFPRAVTVQSVFVYNAAIVTRYLQGHNRATAPPDGASTVVPPMAIGAQQSETWDMGGEEGVYFSAGFYLCSSSTDVTKTLSLTNDLFIYALIRPD